MRKSQIVDAITTKRQLIYAIPEKTDSMCSHGKKDIVSTITERRQRACAIIEKRQIACAVTEKRQIACAIMEKRQIACSITEKRQHVITEKKRGSMWYHRKK